MLLASWWDVFNLTEMWQWLVDVIICAMKRWICWAIETLFGWLETALDVILAILPAPPAINLTPVNAVWNATGQWIPTTLALALFGAYGLWVVGFLVFRTVKKFIPTLA